MLVTCMVQNRTAESAVVNRLKGSGSLKEPVVNGRIISKGMSDKQNCR
jgi:hypothetical protein